MKIRCFSRDSQPASPSFLCYELHDDSKRRGFMTDIKERKADHLDLCATDQVAFQKRTTLLECVQLMHHSLPDISLDEIDLSVSLFGRKLKAPIVVAGMTGGHERAAEINRGLAKIANDRGYAFGVGSQRAMMKRPETKWTYEVRDIAPDLFLLGNIGVIQASVMKSAEVKALGDEIGVSAMCIHVNPAQELIQPEGDRDFRNGTDTFKRLCAELDMPIIAKETGSGISKACAEALAKAGVKAVDTGGAGGTSWIGVETMRAHGHQKDLGELLWDWGVPTAASIVNVTRNGMQAIATGGLKNGYDLARAIALGATCGGFARAVFQSYVHGGEEGANAFFDGLETQLRSIMLLCGAKSINELQNAPKMIRGELREWMEF